MQIGNYDDRNKYSQRRETILKTKTKVIRKPARGGLLSEHAIPI